MALTIVVNPDSFQTIGDTLQMRLADITFDSSYALGGETIVPNDVGLRGIYAAFFCGGSVAKLGVIPCYYRSSDLTGKLLVNAGYGGLKHYNLSNILAADAEDATKENADSASTQTNSTVIGNIQTFTAMAGTKTITLQPDCPRNVVIYISNTTGGALNLYEGVTTFTVTGTFRGAAQVELITFTSTAGNKSVGATTNFRWKAGVKPFDTITSITYTNAPATTLSCTVGPGIRFGLPTETLTGVEADIKKIVKSLNSTTASADIAVSGQFNATYKTVNIGAVVAFQCLDVWYMASPEVTEGFDLSAHTARMMFIGV